MKVNPAKAESVITSPPVAMKGFLLYGPDTGKVTSWQRRLLSFFTSDPKQEAIVISLPMQSVKEKVAQLHDHLFAMNLMGERSIIHLFDAGNSIPKAVKETLTTYRGDNPVVVTAGDLPPSSSLRQFFEKESHLAAIAAYADDAATIRTLVAQALKQEGFTFEPEVPATIASLFGGDRLIILNELEKLMLYAIDRKRISNEDIQLSLMDSADGSLDQLCHAVADCNHLAIETELRRALSDGLAVMAILRSLSRYFARLYQVKKAVSEGADISLAMKSLRPPVFFKHTDLFKHHVKRWNEKRLNYMRDQLLTLEENCKGSNMTPELALSQFLVIYDHELRQEQFN